MNITSIDWHENNTLGDKLKDKTRRIELVNINRNIQKKYP